MTTHELAQTQQAWEAIAQGYDEFVTPTHLSLGGEALARAGVAPGARFLDVAAGSGALSLPAARLGARVTATDITPAMLERLGERARQEGLDVETRVMDGHALELEDDSFDAAGSQYGVMLFPDLPRALREMKRVTRPGGRGVPGGLRGADPGRVPGILHGVDASDRSPASRGFRWIPRRCRSRWRTPSCCGRRSWAPA